MAVRTRTAFKATKNSRYTANTTGDISSGDGADTFEDVADSMVMWEDDVLDEDDMASNSDTHVPTQQSLKAYVDAQVGGGGVDTDVRYFFQADFLGPIYYTEGFFYNVQNFGAFDNFNDFGADGTEKAFGVHALVTGTDSAGGIRYYRGASKFGFGHTAKMRFRVAVSAVSDGTDTYTVMIGYTNQKTTYSTTPDGIYFKYTHSVNGGKYQCVTRASGTETATDSGLTPSTSYEILEIRINADASSIEFYVNGSLVQTHATNIPSNTQLFMQAFILKSAGSTSRELYLDWCDELITRTTAR